MLNDEELSECIICYEEKGTISNPLFKANDILHTECGCKYYVHHGCINEWFKTKQRNFKCINCNTPVICKSAVSIDIMDEEGIDIIDIYDPEFINNENNCCSQVKSTCVLWAVFVFIMAVILLI